LYNPFTFSEVVRIYIEEARDRLVDPLATWKIQGANSCQMKQVTSGNINSKLI
jgi:hypothetical protein